MINFAELKHTGETVNPIDSCLDKQDLMGLAEVVQDAMLSLSITSDGGNLLLQVVDEEKTDGKMV
jgi:hypothetical protein